MALTKVTYSMIDGAPVNVLDYGAIADGVTDSTAAIIAAEAAAYSSKSILTFPANSDEYLFSGYLTLRCSVSGYGATIKQTSSALETNPIFYVSSSNIDIIGITLDGNSKSAGLLTNSASDNLRIVDCNAINCLRAGFGIYESENSFISKCKTDNTKYVTGGTGSADGFYLGGCVNTSIVQSYANNFRRIGFVSESSDSVKSSGIIINDCVANDANNCDDSLTEFNAAFWVENTNNATVSNCVGTNIAGNTGQTSGRVAGLVYGGGENIPSKIVFDSCFIGDASGTLPSAIKLGGSTTDLDIVVSNCYVNTYNVGVSIAGNSNSVTVNNLTAANGSYTNGAFGAIVIDGTNANNNKIVISNITEISPTFTDTDSGTINVVARYVSGTKNLVIENCKSARLTMRQAFTEMFVSNSDIVKQSVNYNTFATPELYLSNSSVSSVAAGTNSLILSGLSGAGAVAYISNTTFNSIVFEIAAESVKGIFSNCNFQACSLLWNGSGTGALLKMNGCYFTLSPAVGSIIASIINGTKDTVMIQNSTFYASDVSYTPIVVSSHQPDYVILHGCNYNTTTFTTLVGGTVNSQVNNIQTL